MLKYNEIVGIFDLETISVASASRDFLKKAEKDGRFVSFGSDLPKSFVVTRDGKVYSSKISSSSLANRGGRGRRSGAFL